MQPCLGLVLAWGGIEIYIFIYIYIYTSTPVSTSIDLMILEGGILEAYDQSALPTSKASQAFRGPWLQP